MAGPTLTARSIRAFSPPGTRCSTPPWGINGLALLFAGIADGSDARTLVTKSDGTPSVSPDGRHLAYLANDLGSEQLWIANADGSKARDLSQLSGLDVQDVAWTRDGRVVFTALGRSNQVHSGLGPALAISALILEGILVAGAVLLLVRRWNVPLGAPIEAPKLSEA